MKIFRTAQIKSIDAATIKYEPIASIDLMERAAQRLTEAISGRFGGKGNLFAIFAGPGNNGGDGLAVARMLAAQGETVKTWLVNPKHRLSPDCGTNLSRLQECGVPFVECHEKFDAPTLSDESIIIDALFGSGLGGPVGGLFAEVVEFINNSRHTVVSVDIPSGLPGEYGGGYPEENIVRAHLTYTLQFPKLSLLMPENEKFFGSWQTIDINLSPQAIADEPSNLFFTKIEDVRKYIKPRSLFSHKGDNGRALLVAGSQGMAGASILAARACLRSGVGLLTLHIPRCNNSIVQSSVPEAMTKPDCSDTYISEEPCTNGYNAVAIGPGLGNNTATEAAVLRMIEDTKIPLILDADALNILARNPASLEKLPPYSILTPHPGEFARLAGTNCCRCGQMEQASALAQKYNIFIILKGAYTAVCTPEGEIHFNSSGNPGMAKGGSGDTLTGILLALIAGGYTPREASIIAPYIHGLAGDIAAARQGMTAMTAGDIIDSLPSAWKMLE